MAKRLLRNFCSFGEGSRGNPAFATHEYIGEVAARPAFIHPHGPATDRSVSVNKRVPVDVTDMPIYAGLNKANWYDWIPLLITSLELVFYQRLTM